MTSDSVFDPVLSIVHLYRLAMRSGLKANEIGLNAMHVKCLMLISRTDNCTANDIVHFLARDKAQIARLIKEMIDNNWLTKTASAEDKRSLLLSLTEEGKALVTLISKTQRHVYNKMQENLTFEELKEFSRIANLISNNLRSF